MTVTDLIKALQKIEEQGYGDKSIYVKDDCESVCQIDSVQKNTKPTIEPEYLFIMAGDPVELESYEI